MTPELRRTLIDGLNQLRRGHAYVEDCWYSCPKAPEGCCDDSQGDECNCGADVHNTRIDSLIWLVTDADAAG